MGATSYDRAISGAAGTPGDPLQSFGSATENAVLRNAIRSELIATGPMSFRRFMELALYDPDEGYYRTRAAIGPRGDYLTSPELHPLFGAVLCRQLAECWALLEWPEPFTLVEVGGGNGTLARAILSAATGTEFGAALSYTIVEPGRLLRESQAATLGSLAASASWVDSLPKARAKSRGCVLSNELLDSFPVHRVTVQDGRLRELYADVAGDRFVDTLGEPSTPALAGYFERLGLLPGEGAVAEVNLDLCRWMATVASALERGYVLTLDYGYPAPLLYAPWRKQGTLHCYSHHTVSTDPYARIGKQDLTTHVDFTSLVEAGRVAGLESIGFTSQQHFLAALGIGDALAGGPAAASSLEEYLARRRAVGALLDPQGLGRVRVLAQGRNVGSPSLQGFAGSTGEGLL